MAAKLFSDLADSDRKLHVDEKLLRASFLSFGPEFAVYGTDLQAGVNLAFAFETEWLDLSLKAPLQLHFLQASSTQPFSEVRSNSCRYLSCREWLDSKGDYKFVQLLRVIELLQIGDLSKVFNLEFGVFKSTIGHATHIDSLNPALIWEQRKQSLNISLNFFSGALNLEFLNPDVLSPHLLNVFALKIAPFQFLDIFEQPLLTDLSRRIEVAGTLIPHIDISADNGTQLKFWQYTKNIRVQKVLLAADTSISIDLFNKNSLWQFKPLFAISLMYGLNSPSSNQAAVGAGAATGFLIRNNNPYLSFLLDLRAHYNTRFHHFSLFSSYFSRDSTLMLDAEQTSFGARINFEALMLESVRFGTRVLLEQRKGTSLLELYLKSSFYGINVSASVLTPYFNLKNTGQDIGTIVSQLIAVLDLSVLLWGPISGYVRVERSLLPKYRMKTKGSAFERRFLIGLSADFELRPL